MVLSSFVGAGLDSKKVVGKRQAMIISMCKVVLHTNSMSGDTSRHVWLSLALYLLIDVH